MKKSKTAPRRTLKRPAQSRRGHSVYESLYKNSFSLSKCFKKIEAFISPIVTPLLLEGQVKTSLNMSKIDTSLIARKFLEWLKIDAHKLPLEVFRKENSKDKLFLDSLLKKSFLQFFQEYKNLPSLKDLDGNMADLNFEQRETRLLSHQILDGFWEILKDLETEQRFIYQLYLEGIYPSEIASLFNFDLEQTNAIIADCKRLVGDVLIKEVA